MDDQAAILDDNKSTNERSYFENWSTLLPFFRKYVLSLSFFELQFASLDATPQGFQNVTLQASTTGMALLHRGLNSKSINNAIYKLCYNCYIL